MQICSHQYKQKQVRQCWTIVQNPDYIQGLSFMPNANMLFLISSISAHVTPTVLTSGKERGYGRQTLG